MKRVAEELTPEEIDEIGELAVAEYLVFLLAYNTYDRYVYGIKGPDFTDDLIKSGVSLIRMADRAMLEPAKAFFAENVTTPASLNMVQKAFRLPNTKAQSVARRAEYIRIMLKRGGPALVKSLFKGQKAQRDVKMAMTATMIDDADQALRQLAAIPMHNPRLRGWIDAASDSAGSGTFVNPVGLAASEAVEAAPAIMTAQATQAARPGTEEAITAVQTRETLIAKVQSNVTQASQRALSAAGMEDKAATVSEVHGIVAATVAAAMASPEAPTNLPAAFINNGRPLDAEQVDAAMTDGRVLVAAGAGAGKSTTLVSRIAYLINDKQQDSGKILACCFNKKAQLQLEGKIKGKVGANNVRCKTIDGLFRNFVVGNESTKGLGNDDEVARLRDRLISDRGKIKPGAVSQTIRNIWSSCGTDELAHHYKWMPEEWFDGEPPKAKKATNYMNQWRGNGVTLEQAKELVTSKSEAHGYIWYEWYLGLKGDLPGWKPPCADNKSFQNFMLKYRKGKERLGDMTDMQTVLLDILRRDPKARERLTNAFDHIMVDEAQDLNLVQHEIFDIMSQKVAPGNAKSMWMIGDDKQCLRSDTLITLGDGSRRQLSDIRVGDKVLSYRNGSVVPQTVEAIWPSHWTSGLQITTTSGKVLAMSPTHKIWASDPVVPEGVHIVYLMYRSDLGYRVGVTNKHGALGHSYGQRPVHERADKLWVLDLVSSRSEALYLESAYSLEYGIPTCVFEGINRGLDQRRLDRVFTKFGSNGEKLLRDRHLKAEIAHWYSCGTTGEKSTRRIIHFNAHGHKGSHVRMEWSGEDLDERLIAARVPFQNGKKPLFRRLRRWFGNYREGLAFANELSELTGAPVRERLATDEGPLNLMTASGLLVGMQVAVRSNDAIELEEIVSISEVPGKYIDMSVTDASNFFGNDVLSSNCIYQFRGSRPELFIAFAKKQGWTLKMIRTNYRCEPEIVDAANRLAAHTEGNLKMEARPQPGKKPGNGSILVEMPPDSVAGALATMDGVVQGLKQGKKLEEFAVLSRLNNELNDYETACIINELPYIRKGGKGFLDANESKALLGYLDLAQGSSFASMKKSLAACIMTPNRGAFAGMEEVEKGIDQALGDLARKLRGVSKENVDPRSLLEGPNVRILADAIKRHRKAQIVGRAKTRDAGEWKYNKDVDEFTESLEQLASDIRFVEQDIAANPNQATSTLLNTVLDGVSGSYSEWNPSDHTREQVTLTLRESITASQQLWSEDADDDDDEEDKSAEEEAEGIDLDEDGNPLDPASRKRLPKEAAGLGAVQFLFKLAVPNDNDAKNGTDPSAASGFLAKIERYRDLSDKLRIDVEKWEAQHGDKPAPAVTLSTIHKVKGAEWENVTVLMSQGVFPMERKPDKGDPRPDPEKEQKALEAERNLAYVALTRAQHNLRIVCPERVKGKKSGLSRFVGEAGLGLGENVKKNLAGAEAPAVAALPDPDDIPELDVKTASEYDAYYADLVEADDSGYDRRAS
jgi:superfamily I DNA/RNA helicase